MSLTAVRLVNFRSGTAMGFWRKEPKRSVITTVKQCPYDALLELRMHSGSTCILRRS